LLLTALLLAGLVGAVQNDRPRSLFEFGVLIVLPPVAGAILATDRDTALDFVRGLTAGTILLIGVAFTEALRNTNFLVASTVTGSFVRGDHIRTNAGWDYPTMLSAFLCLAGFFVVEALRQRWGFPGLVIGGALVTAAVITTQSRSGLLGLAAGALVYLLLQRRASQALAVVLGLAIAGGLLMVLPGAAPASFRDFVGQSFAQGSTANANVVYRRDLYSAAGRALADHPWFGFGYGSGKSVASNALHAYFGTMTDLASLPVSLAVQLGYVGGLAIGLFLLVVVIRVARTPDLPQRLPVAAGIVGCSGAMLGVPVSPPLTWMLLVAGLGWSMVKTHREAMRPGAPPVSDAPTIEPQPGSFVPGGEPATRPESGRW
jgi:O-antigen ligase